MAYTTIKVEEKRGIAKVTLNRPSVHNAMNEQLMKELTQCFRILKTNDAVKVIVLTGEGTSFCAGADLNWMKSMAQYTKEENIIDSALLLDLFETIYTCPKPVIGKINGPAFGGGIGLIAVCDITIALKKIKFAFSEVKLGIIPSVISTYVAPRLNRATMRRLFITGERFEADYAHHIGLIDHIVDSKDFDKTIEFYIKLLKASGPQAIQEIKHLIKNISEMDIASYKDFTVKKIAELRVSEEGQEGIKAFLEKRTSKWSE